MPAGSQTLDQAMAYLRSYMEHNTNPELQGWLQQFFQMLQTQQGGERGAFGMNPFQQDLYNQYRSFGSDVREGGRFDPFQMDLGEDFRGRTARTQDIIKQLQQIAQGRGRTDQGEALKRVLSNVGQGFTPEQSARTSAAMGLLNTGGRTPQLNQLSDSALSTLKSMGFTPAMLRSMGSGQNLLDTGGLTPEMSAAQGNFLDTIKSGGQTDQTRQMFGQGANLISSGGMTPQMQQLFGTQGMTPELSQVFNRAMELVNSGGEGGALIPFQQALSMARDEAATAINQRAGAAARFAQQRAGGGGAAEGSGLVNQAIGDFSDEAARAEAEAVRDATRTQQGLRLNQLGMAFGAAGGAAGQGSANLRTLYDVAGRNINTAGELERAAAETASRNYGIGTAGFNDVTRTGTARMGVGADLLSNLFRTGAQREGQAFQGGLGAETEVGRRLGMGGDMMRDEMATRMNAWNQFKGMLDLDSQREIDSLLRAGNLAEADNRLNVAARQLALQGRRDEADTLINTWRGQESVLGRGQDAQNQGLGALLSLIGKQMGMSESELNQLMSLFTSKSHAEQAGSWMRNVWQPLVKIGVGGGLGALTGAAGAALGAPSSTVSSGLAAGAGHP